VLIITLLMYILLPFSFSSSFDNILFLCIGAKLHRLEQEKGIVVHFMIGYRYDLHCSTSSSCQTYRCSFINEFLLESHIVSCQKSDNMLPVLCFKYPLLHLEVECMISFSRDIRRKLSFRSFVKS